MYKLTATATRNGTTIDATQPEVLGEAYGRLFGDEVEAEDAADSVDIDGVSVHIEYVDAVALAEAETEHVDFPSAVHVSIDEVAGAVVVRMQATGPVDAGLWATMEDDIDLTGMGLTLADSGGIGGPFVEEGTTYVGGTYQRWEPIA